MRRLGPLALAAAAAGLLACAQRPPRTQPLTEEHPSGGTASTAPPGGLAVTQVPQFVQLGFDDNGISGHPGSGTVGGVRFVVDLFAGRRNPAGRGNPRTYDGSPARFSFYVATRYIEAAETDTPQHLKLEWRRVVDAGHEMALHTHSHSHGAKFTTEQWGDEIAACIRWLGKPFAADRTADPEVGMGVPSAELLGFRAPFLEFDRPLFPALRAKALAYDCSIEEGFAKHFDGTNYFWPYRIAAGYGGAGADGELWEIPVYALVVPPDEECERYGIPPGLRARLAKRHDYFDPADGKITGFDWNVWVDFGMSAEEVVATFKYSLDRRLAGNRAPMTFGTHSDIYSDQYQGATGSTAAERRRALSEILDYALAHDQVRVVTARQLLDWLRAPSPLGIASSSAGAAGASQRR